MAEVHHPLQQPYRRTLSSSWIAFTSCILVLHPLRIFEPDWQMLLLLHNYQKMNLMSLSAVISCGMVTQVHFYCYSQIPDKPNTPGFTLGMHVFLDRIGSQPDHKLLLDWMERYSVVKTSYIFLGRVIAFMTSRRKSNVHLRTH